MLVVREKQIQHFIAKDDSEIVKLIVQTIRNVNPERVSIYNDKKLEEMVKIGVERAESHDLELAEDIAAFVILMFEVAPNFDEQEEIKKVLADTNYTASETINQLWKRISDEAWEEAEKSYKADVWFPTNQS